VVVPSGQSPLRDHLFINYGYEDEDLARWLAVKLSVEGYTVWFDQFELLGGESFSRDIDAALKNRMFRMLSVVSKPTVNKPNPSKERQAAFNIGKAEGITDMVIPLKAAPMDPVDLNWQVSDLTWIDFSANWAEGFRQLIKKLEAIGAPRRPGIGQPLVGRWFENSDNLLSRRPERLFSNIVELLEVPPTVLRVRSARENALEWPADWPRVVEGLDSWVMEVPDFGEADVVKVPYAWKDLGGHEGTVTRRHLSNLLRLYVLRRARGRGLLLREDGSAYFPFGLLEKNQVRFVGYRGKPTYRIVAAERSFGLGNDRRVNFWALLNFQPRIDLRSILGHPSIKLTLQLFLTHPAGGPLDDRQAHSYRRRICRHWYNEDWLDRVLAVVSFLAEGEQAINLAAGPTARIVMAGRPFEVEAPYGINEAALTSDGVEDLNQLVDDQDEDVSA